MRIIKPCDVVFTGFYRVEFPRPEVQTYWVEDDNGERKSYTIPTVDGMNEHFEWLSDNDCLRHLKSIEPTLTTNQAEIDDIEHYNSWYQENSHAIRPSLVGTIDPRTMHPIIQGYKPVPKLTYKCVWTFWSSQHAVMFKLARGGSV